MEHDSPSLSYPPHPLRSFTLGEGEHNRHTFLLRSWHWMLERPAPTRSAWLGHLTSRRFLLEPLGHVSEGGGEGPIEIDWNDVIEFEFAKGSLAQERFAGVDDHMIHCSTKTPILDGETEVFLFTCAPVGPDRPTELERHGEAFIELAEDCMLEAFET